MPFVREEFESPSILGEAEKQAAAVCSVCTGWDLLSAAPLPGLVQPSCIALTVPWALPREPTRDLRYLTLNFHQHVNPIVLVPDSRNSESSSQGLGALLTAHT